MAALSVRLSDLTTRIATECKSLRLLVNGNASDLSSLATTNKTNLVSAVNELKVLIDDVVEQLGAGIDDSLDSSTTKTWSITKISNEITEAMNAILNGAPAALDTLQELATAIGNDASFASSVTTALGNRVRHDTNAQGLTLTQKQNARTNIDAFGSVEIGNPDTDFVAIFTTGLV